MLKTPMLELPSLNKRDSNCASLCILLLHFILFETHRPCGSHIKGYSHINFNFQWTYDIYSLVVCSHIVIIVLSCFRNVVKAFYNSSLLFEVLSVFGPLSEDVSNNYHICIIERNHTSNIRHIDMEHNLVTTIVALVRYVYPRSDLLAPLPGGSFLVWCLSKQHCILIHRSQ